jgi:hypothetical protein
MVKRPLLMLVVNFTVATTGEQTRVSLFEVGGIAAVKAYAGVCPAIPWARGPAPSEGNSP